MEAILIIDHKIRYDIRDVIAFDIRYLGKYVEAILITDHKV